MTIHVSRTTHSIFFRLAPGDSLIDALQAQLREAAVATGSLEGHGVLEHVELRTFVPSVRSLGTARAIAGAVHVLASFGTVGLSEGSPQVTLRAVLSRETDSGIETLSGVITSARVVAFEAHVISAQDVALPLAFDARAGVPLVGSTSPARGATETTPSPWADVVATSGQQPAMKPISPSQPALPSRPPVKPPPADEPEQLVPDAGDEVQHFAFGRCEVVKSDGDRLHLKVGKEGRVREIALEMLRVVLLDEDPTVRPRHFRLDRRL